MDTPDTLQSDLTREQYVEQVTELMRQMGETMDNLSALVRRYNLQFRTFSPGDRVVIRDTRMDIVTDTCEVVRVECPDISLPVLTQNPTVYEGQNIELRRVQPNNKLGKYVELKPYHRIEHLLPS